MTSADSGPPPSIRLDLVSAGGAWKIFGWRTDSPRFVDAMKRGAGK
jgi:hypothetical protein